MMTNRFLTHLSSILGLHLLIIFGWSFSQSDIVTKALPHLGAVSLKLRVATQVLIPQPKVEAVVVPKPKLMAKAAPKIRPVETPLPTENTAPAAQHADIKSQYHAELRARIDENKFYPPLSRRLGQKGLVIVAFTLLEDGNIINVRIDSPSSFERLNESALEAVKKVGKFRPIPQELGESKMDIKVPVKFFTI